MPTVICEECETEFNKEQSQINKTNHNFCSSSCSAKYSNKRRHKKRYCLTCGQQIKGTGKKYCCNHCSQEYRYKEYIKLWLDEKKSGNTKGCQVSRYIHRWIRETQGEKCSVCGWAERNPHTNNVPIHLDHIDGNWKNNSPENLRLLCPNCHSLTATYGGANRGNGRPYVVYKREI